MKNPIHSQHARLTRTTFRILAAAICVVGLATQALAQQSVVQPVIPPPPIVVLAETPAETGGTNVVEAGPTGGTSNVLPSHQPFQWGQLTLHPHVSYSFTYGSDIRSSTNNTQNTTIQQFVPGFGLQFGDHWNFDYTATASIYSDSAFEDTINHAFLFNGNATQNAWTYNLSQAVLLTDEPRVETGTQTRQQNYDTALGAVYQMNSDMSLELGAAQNIRFASGFQDSMTWSSMNWLSKQWSSTYAASIGAGVGFEDIKSDSTNSTPDMLYEQFQGRFAWQITGKIRATINGGIEIRQIHAPNADQLVNPIFGATITYQPLDVTTLSLTGTRSVTGSYFDNQVTEATTLNVALTQRLFRRFYLGLGTGYTTSKYIAARNDGTSVSGDTVRTDDYSFFTVSLSTTFLQRGTASIFYSKSRNSSSSSGLSFNSSQVGVQLAYRY